MFAQDMERIAEAQSNEKPAESSTGLCTRQLTSVTIRDGRRNGEGGAKILVSVKPIGRREFML